MKLIVDRLRNCILKILQGLYKTGFTSPTSLEDYFWNDIEDNCTELMNSDVAFYKHHMIYSRDLVKKLVAEAITPENYVKITGKNYLLKVNGKRRRRRSKCLHDNQFDE